MTLMTAEKKEVRFEDLRLLPGQALQLEIEGYTNDRDRSVLVGYRAGNGLIVTTPVINGAPMSLRLGTPLNVRLFATQMNCACAFHTEVVHIARAPYAHLHLAQPKALALGEVRSSVRARVNLIASMHFGTDLKEKKSARVRDISLGGASVLAKDAAVMRDEPVRLVAMLQISGVERLVNLDGIVRSVQPEESGIRLVIQFSGLNDNDKISLQAYVLSHVYFQ